VYETDSRGFPNPEPWPSRASLVFLGDSVAFGYGVGVRESFPHVIGALLSTPVVNLALAGAGPSRQAAVYQKFGIGLRPRHVVACVYAVDFGNDQRFDTWIRRGRTDDYNDLRMTLGRAEDDAETPVLRHYLEKSWLYAHGRDWVLDRLPGREELFWTASVEDCRESHVARPSAPRARRLLGDGSLPGCARRRRNALTVLPRGRSFPRARASRRGRCVRDLVSTRISGRPGQTP
jgi:hypothetical protein